MRRLALLALLAGCGAPPAEEFTVEQASQGTIPPAWQRAREFAWASYGSPGPMPSLRVIDDPAKLTCGSPQWPNYGFPCGPDYPGLCCRGRFYAATNEVIVTNPDAWAPENEAHNISYVGHEFYHAAIFAHGGNRGGLVDEKHTDPEWRPDGLVHRVMESLKTIIPIPPEDPPAP